MLALSAKICQLFRTFTTIAARLARASGGSVILLRVVNEAAEYWSPMTVSNSLLAEAERYLAELTLSPDLQALSTETLVLSGRAAPRILATASSSHVGVIVMRIASPEIFLKQVRFQMLSFDLQGVFPSIVHEL